MTPHTVHGSPASLMPSAKPVQNHSLGEIQGCFIPIVWCYNILHFARHKTTTKPVSVAVTAGMLVQHGPACCSRQIAVQAMMFCIRSAAAGWHGKAGSGLTCCCCAGPTIHNKGEGLGPQHVRLGQPVYKADAAQQCSWLRGTFWQNV